MVYEALDTVEGVRVAMKVPHAHLVTAGVLEDFKREVRHTARLDHPNIVPIKTAGPVGGQFVIVQPLGVGTLAERMTRRVARKTALAWTEQLIDALAHAHRARIMHCDVKPENVILFPDGRVRLADFGISKVARRTVAAGGTGTVGFIAPEQAMGRPSPRSDVFSLGLLLWRLLSGRLPEWPYRDPLPGAARLAAFHPDLQDFLARAIEFDPTLRFKDGEAMLRAFRRLAPKLRVRSKPRVRRVGASGTGASKAPPKQDWKAVQQRQFRRAFGGALELNASCKRCAGPVSEAMIACPWCGSGRKVHTGPTRWSHVCSRCKRGVKGDWPYCAWCYGGSIGPTTTRALPDRRYCAQCRHCRGELMASMRYCPWCRRKVTRAWKLPGSSERCGGCGSGVAREFWMTCPWCARSLERSRRR